MAKQILQDITRMEEDLDNEIKIRKEMNNLNIDSTYPEENKRDNIQKKRNSYL